MRVTVEPVMVREVLVDVGDVVAKGELLARLDDSPFVNRLAENLAGILQAEADIERTKAAVLEAEASEKEARAALERTRSLRGSGHVSDEVFLARQAAVRGTGRERRRRGGGRRRAVRFGPRGVESGRPFA